MIPILTARQMRLCDDAETEKVPAHVLMDRVAQALFQTLRTHPTLREKSRTLILCGSGNNGGDGFALANLLPTATTVVVYVGEMTADGQPDTGKMSPECARRYANALANGLRVQVTLPEDTTDTVIVDAVFGIGLSRPITGRCASLLSKAAARGCPVLAADIPSGLHADSGAVLGTVLPATVTLAIGYPKRGEVLFPGAAYAGEVYTADIGIGTGALPTPATAHLLERMDLFPLLPPRPRRANKGSFGRVLLAVGSPLMSGAAYLSAFAAYLSGAGLVEILTPACNRTILATALPEAIITTYPENQPDPQIIKNALSRADAVVIGCGIGTDEAAEQLLRSLLGQVHVPLVLDADALNLLAKNPALFAAVVPEQRAQTVLTPHPGESARLLSRSVSEVLADIPQSARDCAAAFQAVVIQKDAHTALAAPDGTVRLCPYGNSGMATGGTGDVLAGLVGGLLAQHAALGTGVSVFDSAACAVLVHAIAGDLAESARGGRSLLARDVCDGIADILRKADIR